MKEVIIACEMLENEVQIALNKSQNNAAVIWLERGLHEQPTKLKEAIQSTIDSIDADYILIAFGLCGNALEGIKSDHARLVIPRYHDCIHMFLVTDDNPRPATRADCLYYTDGWFNSDMIMLRQYERFKEKVGEEKAKRVFKKIFKHYRGICLIDTGAAWREVALEQAQKSSDLFELEIFEEKGSHSILFRLFAHEWDEDFIICAPGEAISSRLFFDGGASITNISNLL